MSDCRFSSFAYLFVGLLYILFLKSGDIVKLHRVDILHACKFVEQCSTLSNVWWCGTHWSFHTGRSK